jgi:hypothetical protein
MLEPRRAAEAPPQPTNGGRDIDAEREHHDAEHEHE